MKRNELLNTMRPSKQRKAVEMAMQPGGVTTGQMVATLGMPLINRMRALHVQGLATLVTVRGGDGHVAYHVVTDENLNAQAIRAQELRREAYQRVQDWPMVDDDDCDD